MSCAKFNKIKIFEKPMTSHEGGATLKSSFRNYAVAMVTLFATADYHWVI